MNFFRGLGKVLGNVTGTVVGEPIKMVGEITGAKLLEDIGDGVKKASVFTGDTLGTFTDGVVNTVSGLVQEDMNKRDEGLSNIGDAVGRTAKGVYYTTKNAVKNGGEVVVGAFDGDMEKVKKGASGLVTTVAVGALAIGFVDIIDGEDGLPDGSEVTLDDSNNLNSGTHSVEPNHVEGYIRGDGTVVSDYYRDGDGNPNTQLTAENGGGYDRSNPDGNLSNNLDV